MVYIVICVDLVLRPLVHFFKSSGNNKKKLYDLIWENFTLLGERDNCGVSLFIDRCALDENLYCVNFLPHVILTFM